MAKSEPTIGEANRHRQKLIAKVAGGDDGAEPRLWVIECGKPDRSGRACGYQYGSNGVDFFQRKCPVCQDGAPGPSIAGVEYA